MSWQEQRTMPPGEYKRAIAQLGLNTAQAGRWLGIGVRTAYRYRDGESEIPAAHVQLIRAFIACKLKPVVPPWQKPRRPAVVSDYQNPAIP